MKVFCLHFASSTVQIVTRCVHTAVWRTFSSPPVVPCAEPVSVVCKNDITLSKIFQLGELLTLLLYMNSLMHSCCGVPHVSALVDDTKPSGHRSITIIVSEGWFVLDTASSVTFWAHCLHSSLEKGPLPSCRCMHLFFSLVGFLFRPSPLLSWKWMNPPKQTKTLNWFRKRI